MPHPQTPCEGVSKLRLGIPPGKFRVIRASATSEGTWPVNDFDTKDEAFRVADTHNKNRANETDDQFFVYDDSGRYLRGDEDVDP